MKLVIFEICKVNDKKASFYLETNKAQGINILEFNNTYYAYLNNTEPYRANNVKFSSGWDGEWIFEQSKCYRVN